MLQAWRPELANSNCFLIPFFTPHAFIDRIGLHRTVLNWQAHGLSACSNRPAKTTGVSIQIASVLKSRFIKSNSINLWHMGSTWILIVVFAPSFSQLAALCCGHQSWQPLCSRCMLMHCIGCKSTWCGTSCRIAWGMCSSSCSQRRSQWEIMGVCRLSQKQLQKQLQQSTHTNDPPSASSWRTQS